MVGTRKLGWLVDYTRRCDANSCWSATIISSPRSKLAASSPRSPNAKSDPPAREPTTDRPDERNALAELRDGDTARALGSSPASDASTTTPPKPTPVTRWSPSGSTKCSTGTTRSCSPSAATTSPNSTDSPGPRLRPKVRSDPTDSLSPGARFADGDWVMTLTNDYRLGLLNGQRGAITNIDPQRRTITVAFDDDTTKTLPAAISTPVASTTRTPSPCTKPKDKPATTRSCWAANELYREAGYSALTRGRHENHLYTAPPEPDDEAHAADEPEDGFATVLQALDRSRQQDLAINWTEPHRLEVPSRSRPVDDGLDLGIDL